MLAVNGAEIEQQQICVPCRVSISTGVRSASDLAKFSVIGHSNGTKTNWQLAIRWLSRKLRIRVVDEQNLSAKLRHNRLVCLFTDEEVATRLTREAEEYSKDGRSQTQIKGQSALLCSALEGVNRCSVGPGACQQEPLNAKCGIVVDFSPACTHSVACCYFGPTSIARAHPTTKPAVISRQDECKSIHILQ